MILSTIWSIITKVIDVCIVWCLVYYILKNVKHNSKMVLIVKGILIILVFKLLSDALDLYTVGVLLEYVFEWGPLALIVIERDVSLQDYISPATKVYADLTSPLLGTIFFPNSPLHDGGVIVQGDRITCAGAVFKTSMDPNLNKKLGTRHRAALGIAEESDAVALIVSEETGRISIAVDHEIHYNLSLDEFRMMLVEELKPKTELFYDADGAEREGEDDEI